jgi:hypothetical protein
MSEETKYYDGLFSKLLTTVPEFLPQYDEHLQDNFGEVLPTLLMGDFARFLTTAHEKSTSGSPDSVRWKQLVSSSIDLLDQALGSGDERLEQLILSFLEDIHPSDPEQASIRAALARGPHFRKALRQYYSNDAQ